LDVLITSKVPFMECYSRDKGRFLFEGEFAWPSVAHFMESLTSEVASGDDKGEQDASKDDTDL
jgi:hypothetical protein